MLHHSDNHSQIHREHQCHRDQRGFQECLRTPYGFVCRQAVAVVIHAHHHVFERRVAEQITDCRRKQRHNHRHGEIMSDKLSLCVTGGAERSDCGRFLCDGIAYGHRKNEGNDHNQNIQQHTAHCLVRPHVFRCKSDRGVCVLRRIILQLVVACHRLCQQGLHKVIREMFLLFFIRRVGHILPRIHIMKCFPQTCKALVRHHRHIKLERVKHQIRALLMQGRVIDIGNQSDHLV